MAGARTEFFAATSIIDNTRHRIAYSEWGDPGNPNVLVSVHGLTRNRHDFDFLAEDYTHLMNLSIINQRDFIA